MFLASYTSGSRQLAQASVSVEIVSQYCVSSYSMCDKPYILSMVSKYFMLLVNVISVIITVYTGP